MITVSEGFLEVLFLLGFSEAVKWEDSPLAEYVLEAWPQRVTAEDWFEDVDWTELGSRFQWTIGTTND